MAKKMFRIGEKPGAGTYECVSCKADWRVELEADKPLPPCGTCGQGQNVKYQKVG